MDWVSGVAGAFTATAFFLTVVFLTDFAFALAAASPVAATAPAANGLTTLIFFFTGLGLVSL